MKTSTDTSKIIRTVLALIFFAALFIVYLSSCNQSKLRQSYSPTSAVTTSDSSGVATIKGKGIGKKDSTSAVKPDLPPPGSCLGYQDGSQYVAGYYQFEYLPRDGQGKYLMLVGGSYLASIGGYNLATLYNKYCFRRAVVGDYEIGSYTNTNVGFNENQLLISIGYHTNGDPLHFVKAQYVMNPNWQTDVSNPQYKNGQVLGFWMDEPSGFITGSQMASIKSQISQNGGRLWLEDYDTGPIPSNLYAGQPYSYHLADVPMLQNADYISCNGNTSYWVNGENISGINVLIFDYLEFQGWFGNRFNTIACQPTDGSGALRNDATMYNWMINYPNVNNFAIYIGGGITNVADNNVSAREAGLDNLMSDAYNAGFLGYQYRLYNYTYVCQTSCVNFTPPSCPTPPAQNTAGAGGSIYYGVWTNSSYYSGPVNPSTPGATICWILQSTAPTSQVTYVHP